MAVEHSPRGGLVLADTSGGHVMMVIFRSEHLN